MFCPDCGSPNENQANFCFKCGKSFKVTKNLTAEGYSPPGTGYRPQTKKHKKIEIEDQLIDILLHTMMLDKAGLGAYLLTKEKYEESRIINKKASHVFKRAYYAMKKISKTVISIFKDGPTHISIVAGGMFSNPAIIKVRVIYINQDASKLIVQAKAQEGLVRQDTVKKSVKSFFDSIISSVNKIYEQDGIKLDKSCKIITDAVSVMEKDIKNCDETLIADPESLAGLTLKATILGQLGSFEEEIKCYDRILEMSPDIDTWFKKGSAYNKLGKFHEAIKCHDKALEIDSENSYAWLLKGIILDHNGETEEAMRYYDKAIILDSNNKLAWFCKGQLFYNLKNNVKALEHYDKSLEIDSRQANVLASKALILNDRKKYKEALKLCREALEIEPDNFLTRTLMETISDKLSPASSCSCAACISYVIAGIMILLALISILILFDQ